MTMTVRELIERLEDFDPNTPVRIGSDYGDYVHTTAIEDLSDVREETIYHRNAYGTFNLPDEDDDPDMLDDVHDCVVLFDTTCVER